jgi:hypothetical protein
VNVGLNFEHLRDPTTASLSIMLTEHVAGDENVCPSSKHSSGSAPDVSTSYGSEFPRMGHLFMLFYQLQTCYRSYDDPF